MPDLQISLWGIKNVFFEQENIWLSDLFGVK